MSERKRAPRININLVEHLDSDVSLFEVNVIRQAQCVQLLFTDINAEKYEARLTSDGAWALSRIIDGYDRRAVLELGVMLAQAATELSHEENR